MKDPRVEKALIDIALKDSQPNIRYAAMDNLYYIGTTNSIRAMSRALARGSKDFVAACTEDWMPKGEQISESCVGGLRDKAKSVVRVVHERLTAKPLAAK